MSDVFDEVEEGLRQDRAAELWKKYAWAVYALVALIIAATLAWSLWRNAEAKRIETNVQAYETARAAFAERRYADAETALAELAAKDTEISPLAAHLLAQVRIDGMGDTAGAIAALEMAMAGADQPLADQARMKIAYLRADQMSMAELEDFLAPLRGQGDVFDTLAVELIAAKAYATGDMARAREEYSYLSIARSAPDGLKQRAANALAVIPAPKAAEPAAPETPEETPPVDETEQPADAPSEGPTE